MFIIYDKKSQKVDNRHKLATITLRNNLMGNIMSNFLKFSLASVLAIGVFNISPTFAQEDGDVEEVIVTGSKIKKVDIFDSSKPLEVVDAAQIERTGLNNIGDVLQNLTSSDGTGIRPVTTATNGGDGSNEISLRNLGAGRTLVLIDGRRWVTDAFGTVDMQTIPASIIKELKFLRMVLLQFMVLMLLQV